MPSASLKARGGVKRESWDSQLSLDLDSAGAFKKKKLREREHE